MLGSPCDLSAAAAATTVLEFRIRRGLFLVRLVDARLSIAIPATANVHQLAQGANNKSSSSHAAQEHEQN